jgi:hypothetical protein
MQVLGLLKAKNVVDKIKSTANGVQAILLYGPEGAGKGRIVEDFILHWIGEGRAQDAYHRGANPDVLFVRPIGPSRIIKIAQLNKSESDKDFDGVPMTDFLRMAPLYSQHKVVVIEDADRMNDSSCNALLKPLEEPQSYAKIVLTTTTISRIRPTILSRCLVVACELPTGEEITSHFVDIPNELIQLAEGAPGIIQRFSQHQEFYTKIINFTDRLATSKVARSLVLADELKSLADELDDHERLGARVANARILELVSVAFTRRHPENYYATSLLIESHRKIVGNGAVGLVFDAMITAILSGRR